MTSPVRSNRSPVHSRHSASDPAITIDRDGYQIVIYEPVAKRAPLSSTGSFVQIVWKPASKLPPNISEQLDLDGDGRPDCVVSFQVPGNPRAALHVDVQPLNALVKPMNRVSKESLSALIARVNDTIVVRVPLNNSDK